MALIDYEQTPLRPVIPQPGGLNDLGAQANNVVGGLRRIGNPFPATTQALQNAGQNFSQRVNAGDYAGAAGGSLRDTALTAQSVVDDALVRPSRAIADSFSGSPQAGPGAGLRFFGALTGNQPTAQPATQSQVRGVDNALAAQAQPSAAAPAPIASSAPPTIAANSTTPANGGRPFPLGSAEDTAFQSANLRSSANMTGPGPTMGVIDSGADARQAFFDNANLRTAAARTTYSPRRGYSSDQGSIQAAAIPIQERARLREMSLKNAGDLNTARLGAATTMRGQDLTAQTAANAQATTERGQDISARTAAVQARQQQMNQDRSYQLDVAKFGQDQAKTNFEQRIKSREDVESQVKGMIPAGPDGKPDANAQAQAMSSINNAVAQRTAQLQAQVQRGGANAAGAQKELDALEKDPYAALGQDNIRKLVVGQSLTNTARETATGRFNPIGTSYSGSSAPVSSLRADPGVIGTDYVATHADGSTSVIPARKLRDQFGNISPDYNLLIQK